jgi:hypothetical protein
MNPLIPISQMRKKFGEIETMLPYVDHITITKKGKPLAIITAAPEIKRSMIKKYAGSLKGSELDNEKIWKRVFKRKSRKKPIKL